MIYPLLWLLMSSFKSNDTMFHNAFSLIPEKWDIIQNYASGFKGIAGISFWTFFKNSAIVTVASVAGSIFCSLLAAYAVSRVEFKGANFWFGWHRYDDDDPLAGHGRAPVHHPEKGRACPIRWCP